MLQFQMDGGKFSSSYEGAPDDFPKDLESGFRQLCRQEKIVPMIHTEEWKLILKYCNDENIDEKQRHSRRQNIFRYVIYVPADCKFVIRHKKYPTVCSSLGGWAMLLA